MEWIKMRANLVDNPKVFQMCATLKRNARFNEWIGAELKGLPLRHVIVGLLLQVWSAARDVGKFRDKDLILEIDSINDLDDFAHAPGIGLAMEKAGWVVKDETGIILPNFLEQNPKTERERQREHRSKKKQNSDECHVSVTDLSQICHTNVTPIIENNREEKKEIDNTNIKNSNSLAVQEIEKFAPALENPVVNLQVRYLFRKYGCLPNLAKRESQEVLGSIQNALDSNTAAFSLLDEYFNKPPPDRSPKERIGDILTFLGLTGRSIPDAKYNNPANGAKERRPCGGGRWETFTPRHVSFS